MRRFRMIAAVLGAGVFAFQMALPARAAQTLRLKGGIVVRGTVTARTATQVRFRTSTGIEMTFPLALFRELSAKPPTGADRPSPRKRSGASHAVVRAKPVLRKPPRRSVPRTSQAGGRSHPPGRVVLARAGQALMPILRGGGGAGAEELQSYLKQISGADFQLRVATKKGEVGIYVGLAADFPWLKFANVDDLGPEGFILKSDGKNLYLVAKESRGVQHAVTTLLHKLGCRWFFPGKVWEVVPKMKTISGSWNERQRPAFTIQRSIWYGFGAYGKNRQDKREWDRHNRMGSAMRVKIGHSRHGMTKADFDRDPTLFALRKGKRTFGSKPCYSHPEYIRRAVAAALKKAASGAKMISMTPADGLGYCECPRCHAVGQGGKVYWQKRSQFAKRPDGKVVNITSDTLFNVVNQAAKAIADRYPETLIGSYAYSAYSHPPSFPLQRNVFIQTTTAFRRTPMKLSEQLATFKKMGVQSGIRAYFSAYQWDWDYPVIRKGELSLPRLVRDLRFYSRNNVQSMNAEAGCNWGPRGLGYYLAAQLLWDVNANARALIADFYEKAFGPAAAPMERYYARWLGSYVVVRNTSVRSRARNAMTAPLTARVVRDELDNAEYSPPERFGREALKAAFRDLDEAARRVKDRPEHRARIVHLRLYAHYLYLRIKLAEAAKSKDKSLIVEAIRNETVFGARIMNTNMIHARPLIGKAFHRRFRKLMKYLAGMPEGQGKAGWGKGFRKRRSDVPAREELEKLWAQDKSELEI